MIPVPKLWPKSTIAVIASGPSLTQADCDYVRGRVTATIAINESYQRAPWADVLYGCDGEKFWRWNKGVPSFTGRKYMMDKEKYKNSSGIPKDIPRLRDAGETGLCLDPSALANGQNSAYQGINLAVHFGARRIVLLGVDLKNGAKNRKHWHDDHPWSPDEIKLERWYLKCRELFLTIVEPLQAIGVDVVNCSPDTALTCFPRMTIAEALPDVLEMAS